MVFLEVRMALLKFNCPATGCEVDTGIDLDAQSFAALPRVITPLTCPHCDEPHLLAHIQAWLGELEPA
jgi:hypothetical protein